MRYPQNLNIGDTIGVTAPSSGITREDAMIKLNNVKVNFEKLGYKYLETDNVRKDEGGRSSSGQKRAEEFLELWQNESVKSIISAEGGDFEPEMLEFVDLNEIGKLDPKWFQGYSDNTNLGFVLTTNCDIATIYGSNVKAFGTRELYKNQLDSLKLMSGNEIKQDSYEMYEDNWLEKLIKGESEDQEVADKNNEDIDPLAGYNLVNKVEWKNLKDENEINMHGRIIGGCFDVIVNLIGTKYDKVSEFIEKYKEDGIIWFLEVFEMSTPQIYTHLWQLKNAGYFKYCKGIIFGRSLMVRVDYDMDFKETLLKALEDLEIPVIYDADIGHLAPTINIVNGSIVDINSKNGKGSIMTYFK